MMIFEIVHSEKPLTSFHQKFFLTDISRGSEYATVLYVVLIIFIS